MRLAVGLIVFAALLRGLVWAVALPPWQGPDEPAHFAYIQRIATTGEIPAQHHAPPDRFSVATEVSVRATGYLPFRTRQPLRLLRRGLQAFPVERDDLPQKNHGGLITWKYPPAYYLVATPAYLLPFLHTDTERLYAVRSVSAILGAITVWLVLALLLEAGVAPAIALLGVSAYALLPMVSQASAICNPDVLLMAALAGLARSLLVLCRGWNRRSALVVALWALLATLTKPIGGPAAAMVIVGDRGLRHGGANRAPPRRSGRRDRRGARGDLRRRGGGCHVVPVRHHRAARPRFATASRTCGSSTCLPSPSWTRRIPPTARSTRSRRGESGSRRAPASSAG